MYSETIIQDAATSFRADIYRAQSWRDLEKICTRMDRSCLRAASALPALQELCELVSQRANALAQYELVPSAELIETVPSCDCCGAVNWRDSGGQTVCAICHPDPRSTLQRRAA